MIALTTYYYSSVAYVFCVFVCVVYKVCKFIVGMLTVKFTTNRATQDGICSTIFDRFTYKKGGLQLVTFFLHFMIFFT